MKSDDRQSFDDQLDNDRLTFWVHLRSGAPMAVVRSGPGDGEYDVRRLITEDGRCAGCEVDFFADG